MAGKQRIRIGKRKKNAELIERKKLTINEKIKELEEEISKTKYNKKTQHAIGLRRGPCKEFLLERPKEAADFLSEKQETALWSCWVFPLLENLLC